ncbi:MAG: winged helix-turn-helix domain-containing protein, partial [Thermoanaerobaculia bacterium]
MYRLQPKVMEVLVYLAERSDEVVSKEKLLEDVWPNTYVTEYVLWRCIAQLRKALDDDAAHPRFIKTLSKRGYQLIVPVSRVAAEG